MKTKMIFASFISIVLLGIFFLLSLPYLKGEKSLMSSEKSSVASMTDQKEKPKKEELTAESLEREIKKQDLYASDAKYVVLHDEYKALYPDNLQATIKNNTNKDIKDVQYGFVAWDKNGLPIKIKGSIDFGKSYFRGVTADAANIKAHGTFGEDKGYRIDSNIGVYSFKPFVVSYTDFDGKKWTNPKYKDFLKVYEGKRLKDIKGAKKYIFFKDKPAKPEEKAELAKQIDPVKYEEISKKIKEKSEISSKALEEYIAYLEIMGLLAYIDYYEMENNIDIYNYYDLSEENINLYTEDDFTDYEDTIDVTDEESNDDTTYDDTVEEYTDENVDEPTYDESSEATEAAEEVTDEPYIEETVEEPTENTEPLDMPEEESYIEE